jgi:hypothetical protein
MRAADGGYAARFLSIFVALGVSRFDGESTLPPTAANANRWALARIAVQKSKIRCKIKYLEAEYKQSH